MAQAGARHASGSAIGPGARSAAGWVGGDLSWKLLTPNFH